MCLALELPEASASVTMLKIPSKKCAAHFSATRRAASDWGEGVCRNGLCRAKFVRKRPWQKYCSSACKRQWEREVLEFFVGGKDNP